MVDERGSRGKDSAELNLFPWNPPLRREHRIHDDFVPVRVVTRNNLNSIIYRPRMFGRDPEDEIKASWIEGVLSEVSEFLKFWPGEIIPARRDGEWEP